jgi:hypothetical protein
MTDRQQWRNLFFQHCGDIAIGYSHYRRNDAMSLYVGVVWGNYKSIMKNNKIVVFEYSRTIHLNNIRKTFVIRI